MLAGVLARFSSSELLQRRQLETPSTQQSCARPHRRSARALTVLHYLNAFDTVMICRCSLSPYESFSSQTHWCPCSLFRARLSTSVDRTASEQVRKYVTVRSYIRYRVTNSHWRAVIMHCDIFQAMSYKTSQCTHAKNRWHVPVCICMALNEISNSSR